VPAATATIPGGAHHAAAEEGTPYGGLSAAAVAAQLAARLQDLGIFPEARPADTEALLSASRLVEFPSDGVSIAFLKRFLADHDCAGLSTNEVSDRLVKVASRETPLAAAAAGQADAQGLPLVGPATAFVTYSGTESFARLVGALERLAADKGAGADATQFFWLYPFCLSKGTSPPPLLSQAWNKQYFCHVSSLAHHVTVLDPVAAPAVLTRCWSLFEIAAAVKAKACLHMALAGSDDVPSDMPIAVDFLRSTSTLSEDKWRILHTIESLVGFESISQEIEHAVRAACHQQRTGTKRAKPA
jgi:hypothetical protein